MRLYFKQRKKQLTSFLFITTALVGMFVLVAQKPVLAANPTTMNFQGKVVNADGTNVTNGTYSFVFRLYDNSSPTIGANCNTNSQCWWEETQASVTVTNGVFQVELGSSCAFTSACNSNHSGIDWSTNNALYLTLKFSSDTSGGSNGFMTPVIHLTTVPYAFNADRLGGLAASGFIQNTTSPQATSNFNISGTGVVGTSLQTPIIVTAAATDLSLQPATGIVALNKVSTNNELRVYENAASPANYASITATSSDATFKSNTGITKIGNGTGAITIGTAGTTAINITGHATSVWQTDAGSLTIQGGTTLSLLSTTSSAISVDSGSTGAVNLGTGANAKTTTVGSSNTTSTTNIQSGSGNINLNPSAGNDVVFSQGAGSILQLTASAATTADQLAITNAGQGTSTTAVDGASITFETAGTTNSADNSGLKIDVTSNNNGTTTTLQGLKIGNLSSAEANSTETGLYVGTGWDVGLDLQSGGLNLVAQSDPAAPSSGNLRVYAKSVSGRTMLKAKGSSGVDYPFQPSLFQNNIILFTPMSAALLGGFGTSWSKGDGAQAATTPTPATTSPAIANQIHRFRHANVVTTTNQGLGVQTTTADSAQFWRGNAAGLGGFFFQARFVIELWPANSVRLFAGLSSNVTQAGAVVKSDTVAGDVAGLWHDTTDGANVLSFVTRNNTTTTKASIAGATLAAGQAYDFYMYAKPNDTTIYYRLDSLNSGTTIVDTSTTTTLPRDTIFMGPQVMMSNGTANTTVSTTGIGVARIYVESDN